MKKLTLFYPAIAGFFTCAKIVRFCYAKFEKKGYITKVKNLLAN